VEYLWERNIPTDTLKKNKMNNPKDLLYERQEDSRIQWPKDVLLIQVAWVSFPACHLLVVPWSPHL
jgi:hypothetical protein